MPKNLLAVDDSATMRKVLEITFAGEDFRVVSADGAAGALAKLSEEPVVAVIDTSLDEDGYALAKEVRSRNARVALVMMASRYNPYDANRGRDAGVDDSIDKPFDTQVLIDKVKKAIVAREVARSAVAPLPMTSPAAAAAAPPVQTATPFAGVPRPPATAVAGAAAKPWQAQRSQTLSFEGGPSALTPGVSASPPFARTAPSGIAAAQPAHPAPPSRPSAFVAPPTSAPAAAPDVGPAAHGPTAASPLGGAQSVGAPVAAANGYLAGKLDELGLTPAQVEAVLALSKQVIERVVWEVVPPLAETLIKEEIARLTKES
ncbi:MAG: response regulator [Polyangiaceae bacterium]